MLFRSGRRVPAGEDGPLVTLDGVSRDQPPGVAVRAVDQVAGSRAVLHPMEYTRWLPGPGRANRAVANSARRADSDGCPQGRRSELGGWTRLFLTHRAAPSEPTAPGGRSWTEPGQSPARRAARGHRAACSSNGANPQRDRLPARWLRVAARPVILTPVARRSRGRMLRPRSEPLLQAAPIPPMVLARSSPQDQDRLEAQASEFLRALDPRGLRPL